jgi:hypothetical protein
MHKIFCAVALIRDVYTFALLAPKAATVRDVAGPPGTFYRQLPFAALVYLLYPQQGSQWPGLFVGVQSGRLRNPSSQSLQFRLYLLITMQSPSLFLALDKNTLLNPKNNATANEPPEN